MLKLTPILAHFQSEFYPMNKFHTTQYRILID